jgi:DNA invertase Pin-like site-specific DNA recombinase
VLHERPRSGSRAHAEEQGWEVGEYVDLASAGDLKGRTAWRELLECARAGEFERVIVWKLDRAFRSSLHALTTIEEFERLGIGFQCLTQAGIDTTTASGRLTLQILAAVAEFERQLVKERVAEGLRNARRRGARLGRPPVTDRPGFSREFASVSAEVRAGRLSKRAAARRLNVGVATFCRLLDGVPETKRPRGRPKPRAV